MAIVQLTKTGKVIWLEAKKKEIALNFKLGEILKQKEEVNI